jgi:hypothetical protein
VGEDGAAEGQRARGEDGDDGDECSSRREHVEAGDSCTHVIWKQPGHLTSMKNELGSGTIFLSLWVRAWASAGGLRMSTARAWDG